MTADLHHQKQEDKARHNLTKKERMTKWALPAACKRI